MNVFRGGVGSGYFILFVVQRAKIAMIDKHDKLIAKLDELASQYDDLEKQLTNSDVLADHRLVGQLSIKRAGLADLVDRYRRYQHLQVQLEEHKKIIADKQDPELVELASSELPELTQEARELIEKIANELVTADDRSVGSVILEVRAGTGGAEAALWAGDLFQMYQYYATKQGWTFSPMDFSPGEQGGLRQAVANVVGLGVWQGLGYEGGVHCVKRVPATEAQGRIHTSTATVAVLPEPDQVQIDIPESDVQIHITTAQGPGGQNVNKVATAVHMVHIPTGIEVRMQESKSQHQNRAKAWQLLRARVYDKYQRQKDAERAATRSQMIGSGGRSERVRTYRYKENIVVDHRLSRSFNMRPILEGQLDELVESLIAHDRAGRLAAL